MGRRSTAGRPMLRRPRSPRPEYRPIADYRSPGAAPQTPSQRQGTRFARAARCRGPRGGMASREYPLRRGPAPLRSALDPPAAAVGRRRTVRYFNNGSRPPPRPPPARPRLPPSPQKGPPSRPLPGGGGPARSSVPPPPGSQSEVKTQSQSGRSTGRRQVKKLILTGQNRRSRVCVI